MGNGGWSVAGSGHHPVDQMPRLQRAGKGLMMGNVSSMDHAALAMSLAGRLQDGGTPDHLARLFSVVPRHRFLPDVYWTEDRTRVDRPQDPGTWSRTAYTDQALTTQRDDGAKTGPGIASSSSSAPSVMARMLTAARIEPGMRSEEHTSELQSRFDRVCSLV